MSGPWPSIRSRTMDPFLVRSAMVLLAALMVASIVASLRTRFTVRQLFARTAILCLGLALVGSLLTNLQLQRFRDRQYRAVAALVTAAQTLGAGGCRVEFIQIPRQPPGHGHIKINDGEVTLEAAKALDAVETYQLIIVNARVTDEANAYLLGNFVTRDSVYFYEEPAPSEGTYVVYLRKEYARTP